MSEERPWEDYGGESGIRIRPVTAAPVSEERPWEAYGTEPPVTPAAPPSGDGIDWGDVGASAAGGLGRGTAGLLGLPGTVGSLIHAGLSKVGVPESSIESGAKFARGLPVAQLFAGPDPADYQRSMESITGKFHEPTSTAGQYASTLGEFAPGMLMPGGGGLAARVFNTVAGAAGSEGAGQYFKGSALEPWARAIGGVVGGVAGAKAVTPTAAPTAARVADVATLTREGIPLTAGERTGSNAVRWLESTAGDMPVSSRAVQTQKEAQAAALDRAVTGQVFDRNALTARGIPADANLPAPNVMAAGRQSLSDEYNRLSAANRLHADPQLIRDLYGAQNRYERLTLPSQRATGARDLATVRDDIVNALVAGQGSVPGDVYQAARSRMGTLAKSSQADPYLATGLRETRDALDAAMQRGLSPRDAVAWNLANQRYANMKQLEQGVASAGEHLSPAKLAQSVRSGRAGQYAQGAGNMDELARAAATVLKPLPNSGTAQRLGWQQLFTLPNLISGGGGVLGSMFGPVGAAAGFALPHVGARLAVSRPGQAYLANQALPQNTRDVLAQTLLQQAISQPSGIVQNQAERSAYEQKRIKQRRKAGLE